MKTVSGIHHITAITGDPQKNLDFYEGFLGQRLVKRTVNFDDPGSYHFYFGDASGTPGTLLTFFYFGKLLPRSAGTGEVNAISYRINPDSKDFWMERARAYGISCELSINVFGETLLRLYDPDMITIELVLVRDAQKLPWWKEGGIPEAHALCGFYAARLCVANINDMERTLAALGYARETHHELTFRYIRSSADASYVDVVESPEMPQARQGAGSVHHLAFGAPTDADELQIQSQIREIRLHPTPVIDRQYFHSVYFVTPAGILFEIATHAPGFAIDEPLESLGERLVLPPQYEPHRREIEHALVPIVLPRHQRTS